MQNFSETGFFWESGTFRDFGASAAEILFHESASFRALQACRNRPDPRRYGGVVMLVFFLCFGVAIKSVLSFT